MHHRLACNAQSNTDPMTGIVADPIAINRFNKVKWFIWKSFGLPVLMAAVLTATPRFAGNSLAADNLKKIVFIAGGHSHGFFAHDYLAGSKLLAKRIGALPRFKAVVYYDKWPSPEAFDQAAAIIIYADGGATNIAIAHQAELVNLSRNGVGIGMIHYSVEVPKGTAGQGWLDMIGGYFETFYSVNPFWLAQFTTLAGHPVTNGVRPFRMDDEWYYNMRFREHMKGVLPVLSAIPPEVTRQGADDAYGGNPTVRSGAGKNDLEHVLWVSENFNGNETKPVSRGFGCTGGHFHLNWANDQFRKVILNAVVWIAKGNVPHDGVESPRPNIDELLSNRDPGVPDEQVPRNFDRQGLARKIEQINDAR
jgi:hypothetical protein